MIRSKFGIYTLRTVNAQCQMHNAQLSINPMKIDNWEFGVGRFVPTIPKG